MSIPPLTVATLTLANYTVRPDGEPVRWRPTLWMALKERGRETTEKINTDIPRKLQAREISKGLSMTNAMISFPIARQPIDNMAPKVVIKRPEFDGADTLDLTLVRRRSGGTDKCRRQQECSCVVANLDPCERGTRLTLIICASQKPFSVVGAARRRHHNESTYLRLA